MPMVHPSAAGALRPHPSPHTRPGRPPTAQDALSDVLTIALRAYSHQPVRVLEAIAETMVNRARLLAEADALSVADLSAGCRAVAADLVPEPDGAARAPAPPSLDAGCSTPARDAVTRLCARLARRAVTGTLTGQTAGQTAGATHVHSLDAHPAWAAGRAPIAQVGGLLFYRFESVCTTGSAAPDQTETRDWQPRHSATLIMA